MKKQNFLSAKAIAFAVAALSIAQTTNASTPTGSAYASDSVMTKAMQQSMTPQQALQKLKEGNHRFASGANTHYNYLEAVHETANGQYPSAIVLSCVDSRTSSELIFDQTLGSIFNARIAGNFVNTDILGSMEFDCKAAGAKLILIVGHSKCGAVKGACDHVEMGNLTHVMSEIKPA